MVKSVYSMSLPLSDREDLRQLVMGLGSGSFKKHYYPSLMLSVLELKRFRAVIETIPDFIMILDADGGILDANKAALVFFDMEDLAIKQVKLQDLIPDHAQSLLKTREARY